MKKLGIIAGGGELPFLLAKSVIERRRTPFVISISKELSENFPQIPCEIAEFGVGQIRKILRYFRSNEIDEIAIIGSVKKRILLSPLKLDTAALSILSRTHDRGDRAIMSAVIEFFESNGLHVIRQDLYLSDLFAEPGILTKRKPTKSEMADCEFGIELARQIADLDIGQTVIVKNLMPIAIEAIEGTDATILRGGDLGGRGVVVAKASAKNHDFRIDVPTIGDQTLQVLKEIEASALVIEAGKVFILDREDFCNKAEKYGIAIVAIRSS